jgi:hypothetical protein
MDLTPYLETLRRDLAAAAAPAGEAAGRTADLLSSALEASARLCLLEALSDAAAEITTKLDEGSVEVRMRGRDADLVVTQGAPAAAAPPPPITEGGDVARITLRLPEPLKEQAERAAAEEGISVNAWLVRAVSAALHANRGWPPGPGFPPRPPMPPMPPPPPGRGGRGRRMTGYAQA